jgi:hypothetical protein
MAMHSGDETITVRRDGPVGLERIQNGSLFLARLAPPEG